MRRFIIFILLLILFFACNQKKEVHSIGIIPNGLTVYTDSAYNELAIAFNEQKLKADTAIKKYDSLKYLADSIRIKLFIEKYKVENVKNYIKIVEHNPSQKVFFLGWVKRAVEYKKIIIELAIFKLKSNNMFQDFFFWLFMIIAFIAGLFIGKNNAKTVQKLGEVGESEAGKAIDDIKNKIH